MCGEAVCAQHYDTQMMNTHEHTTSVKLAHELGKITFYTEKIKPQEGIQLFRDLSMHAYNRSYRSTMFPVRETFK